MITFRFYGASDDLVEVEARDDAGDHTEAIQRSEPAEGFPDIVSVEEFGCWRSGVGINAAFRIESPAGEAIRVLAVYDGVWSFAPTMLVDSEGDGSEWAGWTIAFRRSADVSYSMLLEVTVPGTALCKRETVR